MIIEITIKELLEDSDWAHVFADASCDNVDKTIHVVPPGSSVSDAVVSRSDVSQIIAAVNGENDEDDWLGVFLLKDGRFLIAGGGCDYTGWDCRAGNHLAVAKDMDDVLQFGLDDRQKKRLGFNHD